MESVITRSLRLGNYVYDSENKRIAFVTMIDGDELILDVECGPSLDNIYAIPVSEVWLNKFGFKLNETCFFIQVGNLNYLECDKNDLTRWGVTPETWTGSIVEIFNQIRYVHQLQNLFYALTGEELTIQF